MNHYITQIKIEKLRHLSNINIDLSKDKRLHLLLTGKNGSGKTTVLRTIKEYLAATIEMSPKYLKVDFPLWLEDEKLLLQAEISKNDEHNALQRYQRYSQWINQHNKGISIEFNNKDEMEGLHRDGRFIMAYYGADRKAGMTKQQSAGEVVLAASYSLDSNPGNVLLKYLVHLKTQQAYARNEGDMGIVQMLEEWFERFVDALKLLLDNQSIELKYDYKNYDFQIIEEGRKVFGFDQLSDGYSAAIQIVADLILRMEQNWLKKGVLNSYDAEGIVLIDELETHLHIGLQKNILPFLTRFFPKLQFIVSTHSPYILNSIENCVVYDLEKNIRMEDMSGYSAEGIVEGYFEFDSYSESLLQKVKRYGQLVNIQDPTEEERSERATLLMEMKQLSGDLARDAKRAFEEIEDRRKQNDKIQSE